MDRSTRIALIGVLISCLLGAAVLYKITPEKTFWLPPCIFHWLTGLYCPGCGTARGLHLLLHANLAGAWRMNSLVILAIPLLTYLIIRHSSNKLRSKLPALPAWAAWTILAIVILFWIARNIPAYPFTLLAPHY